MSESKSNEQDKRVDNSGDRSVSSGRQSNHQPCQQKRGCRREQAIAAIRVQQEGLNVKEPERSEKHRANGWNEKCSRARISEPRERSEGKRAEISQRRQKRPREIPRPWRTNCPGPGNNPAIHHSPASRPLTPALTDTLHPPTQPAKQSRQRCKWSC